jgi:hypothetical protein
LYFREIDIVMEFSPISSTTTTWLRLWVGGGSSAEEHHSDQEHLESLDVHDPELLVEVVSAEFDQPKSPTEA